MYRLRTTLIHLFCGVVLFGQTAVWMHVGCCQFSSPAAHCGPLEIVSSLEDNCCCHHEHHEASEPQDGRHEPSSDSHDADSCAVCQQVYTPNGVLNLTESVASQRIPSILSEFVSAHAPASTSIEEVRPRGPPSIV